MGASASSSKGEPASTETKDPEGQKAQASEGTPLVASDSETPGFWALHQVKVAIAIGVLISIAVLKTQLTAFLFSYGNYATAYSLWSCVVTCVLLLPVFLIVPKTWSVPNRGVLPTFSLIVVFTGLDLALTNVALANISVAIQQCIAATNPFWALMIESALYCKWQHALIYLTVSAIVVGAILTSVSNIDRVNTWGVFAAVLAVLSSASKYVFTHKAFKEKKGDLGPLAMLFWVDLTVTPVYLIVVLINGELTDMFDVATKSAGDFFQLTGTAALGGVRALTQYWVLALVSATSMSTANIFTQIFNILISMTWQDISVTPLLISGVCVVVVFSGLYTYFKSDKQACGGVLQQDSWGWLPCCKAWKEKGEQKEKEMKEALMAQEEAAKKNAA